MTKNYSKQLTLQHSLVEREKRHARNKHRGAVVWFTGLSGAGKSTLAYALEAHLFNLGCSTYVLDGDNVRYGLCQDLGFSNQDRTENIRRVGELSKLMLDAGLIVMSAFISPLVEDREKVRQLVGEDNFIEVYCNTPIEACEARDVKGLYKRARAGELVDFTGVSSPYEIPVNADLTLSSDEHTLEHAIETLVELLIARDILPVSN